MIVTQKDNHLFYLYQLHSVNSVQRTDHIFGYRYFALEANVVPVVACGRPQYQVNACSWHPIFCMRLKTTFNGLFIFLILPPDGFLFILFSHTAAPPPPPRHPTEGNYPPPPSPPPPLHPCPPRLTPHVVVFLFIVESKSEVLSERAGVTSPSLLSLSRSTLLVTDA